jgi:hypothetical protein
MSFWEVVMDTNNPVCLSFFTAPVVFYGDAWTSPSVALWTARQVTGGVARSCIHDQQLQVYHDELMKVTSTVPVNRSLALYRQSYCTVLPVDGPCSQACSHLLQSSEQSLLLHKHFKFNRPSSCLATAPAMTP